MEIFNNKMTFTFTNKAAACKAKEITIDVLQKMNKEFWFLNATKNMVSRLTIKNNSLVTPEGEGDFESEELLEVGTEIVKAIAAALPRNRFTFEIVGCDTYTEGWLEGCYSNGTLEMTSTFYPEGYCEYVSCPECGEFIVRLDEYDPTKTYVCPECGEEVDLAENYESCKPIIERKTAKVI